MKIKINRNILIAMQGLASRDVARYILNGVCIEVKGENVFVVATDGRRLGAINSGVVMTPDGEQPFRYVFTVNVAALKSLRSPEVICEFSDKVVRISPVESGICVEFPLIDGNYPSWRQVIPKGAQPQPISPNFNWNLLNSFTKTIQTISGKPPTMTVRQGDPLTAMTIFSTEIPNFIGVLMPLKNCEFKTPEWATQ